MVGGIARLDSLFLAAARYRNIARQEVEQVIAIAPEAIRSSPCFLDRLTGLWRYEFGEPLELSGDTEVFGTHMYHLVDRLYDVLACARQRLNSGQLVPYLARLADPKKHADLLVEFAPILRLAANVQTDYEVSGYGDGNSTVDWLIRPTEGPPILLDVKNRIKDLLESLTRTAAGERAPDGTAPIPAHNPDLLFRSVEQKFRTHPPAEMVQAIWIRTDLKQEETELSAFRRLDPSKVHVAILGDWSDDVHILANDLAAKEHVMRAFRISESPRFVFEPTHR